VLSRKGNLIKASRGRKDYYGGDAILATEDYFFSRGA